MVERCGQRQLFVYWRLSRDDLDKIVASLGTVHAELVRRHPGLRAELMLRGDDAGPMATLMEVYALPASVSAAGLDAAQIDAIDDAAAKVTRPWLQGLRHREVFDTLGG